LEVNKGVRATHCGFQGGENGGVNGGWEVRERRSWKRREETAVSWVNELALIDEVLLEDMPAMRFSRWWRQQNYQWKEKRRESFHKEVRRKLQKRHRRFLIK
jgi:hypothetical protein